MKEEEKKEGFDFEGLALSGVVLLYITTILRLL